MALNVTVHWFCPQIFRVVTGDNCYKVEAVFYMIFTATSVNQNKKLLLACQKTVLITSWRQRSACYCIHLEVKDTDNKYVQPAEMNIHMHCQRAAAFPCLRSERERLNVQRKERKKRMLEDIKLVPWIMSLIQSKGRLKLWWCTGLQFKWSHMQLKWTGFKPKACDEPQTTDHSWHTHTEMCGIGKMRLVFISADMRNAGDTETSH